MKIWKPDTCECVIEEIYQGTEIIGGGEVLKKCVAHTDVADNELYGVLYSNIDGENKRKNQMMAILLDMDDVKLGLSEEKINKDGSKYLGFRDGIEYEWSFSGFGKNRVLNVNVRGKNLTIQEKTAIKNLSENRFGVGKIEML